MRIYVCVALFALAGWVVGAAAVEAEDGLRLSAPGAETAALADDRLAEIAGREKRDDAEIELPRGRADEVDPFSPENVKIVVPLGAQAGGTAAGFAGQTTTVYGLPIVGPRPGPTIGVAGFGILGSAYRPNF